MLRLDFDISCNAAWPHMAVLLYSFFTRFRSRYSLRPIIQNDVISFTNDNGEIAVDCLLQILGIPYVLYYNELPCVQHLHIISEELKVNYGTARMQCR